MPSVAQLESLLESAPDDAFLLYGLGIEHAKAGRINEAVAMFDRCLSSDPAYLYAYYHKARVLIDAGRGDEARHVLDAGVEAAIRLDDAKAHGEMLTLGERLA